MRTAIAALLAAGCGHAAQAPIANRAQGTASAVRAVDWQNHTYALDALGSIKVAGGRAEFDIDEDGRAAATGVSHGTFAVEPPLFADIDGDGAEDAVILSLLSTGGTGHFSEVLLFTVRDGAPAQFASIPGGDRGDGGIRHVSLQGTTIVVERNVLAEGDGVCCPSSSRQERWVWRGGQIVEQGAP